MIYEEESSINNYNSDKGLISLKIILIFLILFYNNNIKDSNKVELDNEMQRSTFENNTEFHKFGNEINIYSIYYLEYSFFNILFNSSIQFLYNHNNSVSYNNIYKINSLLLNELNLYIKHQIKTAKNHGIAGFGIIYYFLERNEISNKLIDMFAENKDYSFPFFLILKNKNLEESKFNYKINQIIDINQNSTHITYILESLKKYMLSDNYIYIKNCPILGIWQPIDQNFLLNIRMLAKEKGLGELYLIEINENKNISSSKCIFNGSSEFKEFPSKSLFIDGSLKNIYYYNYYYDLIKNNNFSEYEIYNLIVLEGSSPEKFYLLSKYIINLVRNRNRNNFILINALNKFGESNFLEISEKYGYSYLNSLSKAILNLNFTSKKYYLNNLNNKNRIAIQSHIYYEYLIKEIIMKINNIPVEYDLYISTYSIEMKSKISKYINNSMTKLNYYQIDIFDNKGRDVLPFLNQLENKIKKYKYICHIHSKRSSANPYIGFMWRRYLYNNLLGDSNIISEIISDFENSNKIGMIFPETYYLVYNETKKLKKKTKKYINFILRKLFPKNYIGILKAFPAGNMFWSRTEAILQIFIYDFSKYFNEENEQTNDTIMHGIERVWLYLVKLNGFYYKTIFKAF